LISVAKVLRERRSLLRLLNPTNLMRAVQERSVANGDEELALKVDETIQLWTKMWMADSDRYNKIRSLLESMHKSSEGCVVELLDTLERLTASMTSQADHFLETSIALVMQGRTASKQEREVVLRRLEAVQKDVEELNVGRLHLQAQVVNLQDDRRSLLLRMEQMVPRSEVSVAQQEAVARACDLRSLERESARQHDTIESLTARLSEMENEKSELLRKLQVLKLSSILHGRFLTFRIPRTRSLALTSRMQGALQPLHCPGRI
jgi:hypothetical protein